MHSLPSNPLTCSLSVSFFHSRPGFSLQACRGAEGAAATAPALSQRQSALLPHGKGPHLSQTHALGLFPEYTRTMLLLAAAVPHDLPVCCYLISVSVCVCAVLCINTGLLCVSVSMGVQWHSCGDHSHCGSLSSCPASHVTVGTQRHEHLTFKEGSGVSNSVPSGLCAKCFMQRAISPTTSCAMFNV